MKKLVCLILAVTMLLSMLMLSGCDGSLVAQLKEEQSLKYDWEPIFTSEVDSETLMIWRHHGANMLGIHCTMFKITIYDEYGLCTYFHLTPGVPCKRGFLKCKGNPADLWDACNLDETIETLYPLVASIVANEVLQEILNTPLLADDIKNILFYDMIAQWYDDRQGDILSDMNASALGITASCNDYLASALELGFAIDDASEIQESIQDRDSFVDYVMPELGMMEQNIRKIMDLFGLEIAKANRILQELTGMYSGEKATPQRCEELFRDVEVKLHEEFKKIIDEKPDALEEFWNNFIDSLPFDL